MQHDPQAAEEWGYGAEGYAEEVDDQTYMHAEQNGHEPYEESQQGFRRRGRSGRGSRRWAWQTSHLADTHLVVWSPKQLQSALRCGLASSDLDHLPE